MNRLAALIRLFPAIMLMISTHVASGSMSHSSIDTRQTIQVNEMQRNHILTEMHSLLSGTQHILDALSKEDMTAVAHHARQLGMGMAHKGEGHLQSILPPEFMQLGMSVHKGFDQIASDAESIKDSRHTLQQMGKLMEKCNACHTVYQLQLRTDKVGETDKPGTSPDVHHHHHDAVQ